MLPQLQAERQLAAIEAACVPSMKPASSQSIVQRLSRRAMGQKDRARSLHEALGGLSRRVEVPKGRKR